MPKKYFGLESAQRQLPKVKKSLTRLQALKRAIEAISSIRMEPKEFDAEEIIETSTKLSAEYHKLSYEFYKELRMIEKLGCIIKDIQLGLVDFYSMFEKREIFLCWQLGEEKIKAWHETDTGFAGRKPIVDLELSKNEV